MKYLAQGASKISKEKILQISNDISESMCTANRQDVMAVASYWADRACETAVELETLRSTVTIELFLLVGKIKSQKRDD